MSVESNVVVTLVLLSDGQKKSAKLCQPHQRRTKTNRDLLARVFPRFTLNICICFDL